MIINQFAGSGGDALPWLFRKAHVGPLVGVRTWGGLVGIGGYPELIDGGTVTAPRIAIGGLHGHWEVENHGIPPDIEVFQDPKLVREGHDPQLETAIREAMRLLAEHPLRTISHRRILIIIRICRRPSAASRQNDPQFRPDSRVRFDLHVTGKGGDEEKTASVFV